jgi:hypothetical protein
MKFIFKKPHIFIFLSTFFIYIVALLLLSNFSESIQLLFLYSENLNWAKLLFSLFISISIGFFIAVNVCFVIKEYVQRKNCKNGGALTGAGLLAGLSLGVCPLCVGGFLPILLGFFGISFSFGLLPFQGIEIQVGVLVLMIFTTYMFYKRKI